MANLGCHHAVNRKDKRWTSWKSVLIQMTIPPNQTTRRFLVTKSTCWTCPLIGSYLHVRVALQYLATKSDKIHSLNKQLRVSTPSSYTPHKTRVTTPRRGNPCVLQLERESLRGPTHDRSGQPKQAHPSLIARSFSKLATPTMNQVCWSTQAKNKTAVKTKPDSVNPSSTRYLGRTNMCENNPLDLERIQRLLGTKFDKIRCSTPSTI